MTSELPLTICSRVSDLELISLVSEESWERTVVVSVSSTFLSFRRSTWEAGLRKPRGRPGRVGGSVWASLLRLLPP